MFKFLVRPEFLPVSHAIVDLIEGDYPADSAEREEALESIVAFLENYHASHAEAQAVLSRYSMSEAPFALLLRGFAIEARRSEWRGGGNVWGSVNSAAVRLQQALRAEAAPVPFVGLKNEFIGHSTDHPLFDSPPLLSIPNTNWKTVVDELIRAADFIVVVFDQATRGVLAELEMIRTAGRQDDTLVVRWIAPPRQIERRAWHPAT